MKFCLHTNVLSPHQLPLARELAARLGADNFRYVYTEREDRDHAALKFDVASESWARQADEPGVREILESADVLLSGLREFDLFARRAARGLRNLYMSETWFKPPLGYFRLLHPRYFGYVRKLVGLARKGALTVLPIGVPARRGFARVGVPESAMVTWGYFVAPGRGPAVSAASSSSRTDALVKVLWAGRLLDWKRVDTLVKAVARTNREGARFSLTVVGDGPEKARLRALAESCGLDSRAFHPPVSLDEVRKLMREHDVYVLSSNASEGWGAVVSEALEEGVIVFGTNQAGASATLLPEWQRFNAGDWRRLAELLEHVRNDRRWNPEGRPWLREIGAWSAAKAANELTGLA